MSKAALDMFSKCAALDLAKQGVRVNVINPAAVDTPMLRRWDDKSERAKAAIDGFARLHPIGRMGQPQDVAELMLYLASDKASWMTGENIRLDGGFAIYSAWAAASDMAEAMQPQAQQTK